MPSESYKPVPVPRKGKRKHMTLNEWRRLLTHARETGLYESLLIRLLYETGIRASEPGKMRLDHCKRLVHLQLWVHRGKQSFSGWFDITRELAVLIKRWVDTKYPDVRDRTPETLLFPGRRFLGTLRPMSRQCVLANVKQLCEEAGVAPSVSHPHAIRHARVQHLFEEADRQDVSLEVVLQTAAKIIGHRSAITTLRHYVAEHGRGKQLADDVLKAALGGPANSREERIFEEDRFD